MLKRLDTSRLATGLVYIAPATVLVGLMDLKFDTPFGIVLIALGLLTLVGALLVARADPEGRSIGQVFSSGDSVASEIGGGLFAAFVLGAIFYSAMPGRGASLVFLALYLILVAVFVIYARVGAVPRTARAAPVLTQPAGGRSELLDALRNANVIAVGDTGARVMSGGELADILLGQTAPCQRCGTPIRFKEGGLLAMGRGIREKVIMCGTCNAVYEIDLNPRGMTLTADVSARYGIQPTPSPTPVAATQAATEIVRLAATSLKEELANFQALAARQQELLDRLTPIEQESAKAFFARAGVDEPNRYDDALAAFGGMRQYAMTAEGAPIHATYLKTGEASADDFLFIHLSDIPPLELLVCALSGGGYLGYYKTGKKLKEALGL